MDVDNPLFLVPVMCGLIFVIASFIMMKYPPKKINMLYGYRTRQSMRSQKHWDFAQKYASGVMAACGIAMAFIGFGLSLIIKSFPLNLIFSLGLLVASAFAMVLITERRLKKLGKH